jgi:hypothetical protein
MNIVQPRLIAAPEVLHREDGWVIWHGGIVDGLNGLQLDLEVVDVSGQGRVTGPPWEHPARPIEVTAGADKRETMHPAATTHATAQAYRISTQFGRFGKSLGPRLENGSTLWISIDAHPLAVHIERQLGPDNPGLTVGTAEPRVIVDPQILHHDNGWLIWHSGVVRGLTGLHATFEILDISGDDRIAEPAWAIPGVGTPPLDVVLVSDQQPQSVVVTQRSTPRSYRVGVHVEHRSVDDNLPSTVNTRLEVLAHPLDISIPMDAGGLRSGWLY